MGCFHLFLYLDQYLGIADPRPRLARPGAGLLRAEGSGPCRGAPGCGRGSELQASRLLLGDVQRLGERLSFLWA